MRQGIEVRLEHDASEEGGQGEAIARAAASLEATFLNSAVDLVGAHHTACGCTTCVYTLALQRPLQATCGLATLRSMR